MLPVDLGGHAAYQDTFVSDFLKFYPDPFVLPKSTWDYIVQFWYLDLSQTDSIMRDCYSIFWPQPRLPSCMLRSYLLALKLKVTSITVWCRMLRETPLYAILSGFTFGDTPGVGTFYDFFSRIWQDGSRPHCRTAAEKTDLRLHDMLSFLHSFFTMKAYLPEFRIEKLLLDSAHDAYAVYEYCRKENITPFIDLNPGNTGHFTYKDDFTIDDDGVPICKLGLRMHKDGYEDAKHRAKIFGWNLTH